MNKHQHRIDMLIADMTHEMLIHGYLLAVQRYVLEFGLHSTAGYILRKSRISKEDLIRCQLENGHENELMLDIIKKAFI